MLERGEKREGAATVTPAPRRLNEMAYQRIKAKILDSEYPPGGQVLEQDIAAELNLSRTPVREALVRLAQEGMLTLVPRHGARISVLSPKDMREIYEVLMSLEPTAVELLARQHPSAKEVEALIEACEGMERSLVEPQFDAKAWARADESFHISLARLCGNSRIATMIMTVWDQAHRARMFTAVLRPPPVQSTQEHRAVLDAILAGDANRARALYFAHRRRAGDELMAIIEQYGFHRL